MIKIIHIITGLEQGGSEMMLYNLLANMDKLQFNNTVISMQDEGVFGDKIKALGIPVHCLHMLPSKLSLKNLIQYGNIIKAVRPSIVQAWMYHANFFSIIARPFLPAHDIFFNVRTTLEGLQKDKPTTHMIVKLNAWLSRFSTGVINNSRTSAKQHQRIGFSKKKSIYIGNGFDTDRLRPCSAIYTKFRKTQGYPLNVKIVAMFARYHPIKNHKLFLEMAKMLKETLANKIIFLMGGSQVDSDNAELMAQITALGLTKQIVLLGNIDVAQYLPATDVVVLPSLGEGFPNIIGEAMACGVPCVATDVGETRNLMGDAGYAVPVNNLDTLLERVSQILLFPPDVYCELSRKCVEHIQNNHSIGAITDQYQKLYSQVKS